MLNISVLLDSIVTNDARCTREIKYQHCHGKSGIQITKIIFSPAN
jgi:hypothetical protein